MKNFYNILRISETANAEEIKHAFRILAHKVHPDKNVTGVNTSQPFIEIKEAYETLGDPKRKVEYDYQYAKFFKKSIIDLEIEESKKFSNLNSEIKYIYDELNKYRIEDSDTIVLEKIKRSIISSKEKVTSLKNSNQIAIHEFENIFNNIVLNLIQIADRIWNDIYRDCFIKPLDYFKNSPKQVAVVAALSWIDDIVKNIIVPLSDIPMSGPAKEKYFVKKNYYFELKDFYSKQINSKSSSKGCYVATLIYGNNNTNRNVIILKYYRDFVLAKYFMGRLFIKSYYLVSPYLVKILNECPYFNNLIKKMLDKMTNHILAKLQ